MRSLRNTQGQMRVVETILASFIIVGALSFVNFLAVSPTSPGYEVTDLERMGHSALIDLDQQGLLTPLVYNQRWSDLRTILKITMPNDVYFNMTVYNISGLKLGSKLNTTPDSQILYGDFATFSDAKNIASIAYCLVGETDYDPRILVLQLSRG
ncbi:MAG: hypothetical protein NWE80_03455 [Candidatus Bathyarchaeota archaeon]|nr:hypothetical protein [Candidatus Bathyarchaeota archaeon]